MYCTTRSILSCLLSTGACGCNTPLVMHARLISRCPHGGTLSLQCEANCVSPTDKSVEIRSETEIKGERGEMRERRQRDEIQRVGEVLEPEGRGRGVTQSLAVSARYGNGAY